MTPLKTIPRSVLAWFEGRFYGGSRHCAAAVIDLEAWRRLDAAGDAGLGLAVGILRRARLAPTRADALVGIADALVLLERVAHLDAAEDRTLHTAERHMRLGWREGRRGASACEYLATGRTLKPGPEGA